MELPVPTAQRAPRDLYSASVRERSAVADDITSLIEAANRGDATARDVLFARVYGELKHLAHRQLAGPHPTLDTTGLVHEAYLKLVEGDTRDLQGRHHFFALAA